MYVAIGSRLNLAYIVTMLLQFSSCPTKAHLAAVLAFFVTLRVPSIGHSLTQKRHQLHLSASVAQAMLRTSMIAAHLPATALC
jgi:hypothetical protein